MFGELSFTEIDRQSVELLPGRIVMSVIMSHPDGGANNGSTNNGGSATPTPSDFAKMCAQSPQNCDALISAFFTFLLGPQPQK